MGTSSSYGGSGRSAWNRARSRFDDLIDGGDEALPGVAQGIADALADEDPELTGPEPDEPAPEPPARPPVAGDDGASTGAAPGILMVETRSAGRSGGGSRRRVVRAARRGALAIGAAYWIRAGDRESLAEVGLDLEELAGLAPRAQRQVLLDAILGEAGHPDDVALRQAADEFLKSILGDTPPEPLETLRRFVASLIFKMGLVEVRQQLKDHDIDASKAVEIERSLNKWIEARLAREDFGSTGRLVKPRDFQVVAMKLVRTAISIIRAGSSQP